MTKQAKQDPFKDQMSGDFPEAFKFENEGDTLMGKVLGFSQGFSEYGRHPIVTIQDEETGEIRSVHCLHQALRSQMEEQNPKPGDRIGIKFRGEKEAKGGRTYKSFLVRVDNSDRSFADAMKGMSVADVDDEDLPF